MKKLHPREKTWNVYAILTQYNFNFYHCPQNNKVRTGTKSHQLKYREFLFIGMDSLARTSMCENIVKFVPSTQTLMGHLSGMIVNKFVSSTA